MTALQPPLAWRTKHLTKTEQQVVVLVATGHAPKDAAMKLNRAVSTVRNHLYTAMRKLDVSSRYELICLLHAHPTPAPQAESVHLEYAI